jgi:hypothetical protein
MTIQALRRSREPPVDGTVRRTADDLREHAIKLVQVKAAPLQALGLDTSTYSTLPSPELADNGVDQKKREQDG